MDVIRTLVSEVVGIGRANLVVVWIETDSGIVGTGETLVKRHDQTVRQAIEELSGRLIGQDATAIENIAESLYRDGFWVGGPLASAARSAVDIALWDIKGQTLGVPVHELLGGPTRRNIGVYCHCPAGSSPEIFARNLKAASAAGYHAAKTTLPLLYGGPESRGGNVGYSGGAGSIGAQLRETEYLPTRVFDDIAAFFASGRAAVGPDFELMLDCHGRLSPGNAVRLSHALDPFNLLFLEEPIPPESPSALADVRRQSRIPIAAGERLGSMYEVAEFLKVGAVDVLQCDVVTCGGITGLKKISALAEAHYVAMAPHNPNGPVSTMATAQVLMAIPNAFTLESVGSLGDQKVFKTIADQPIVVKDGYLEVGSRPGIGVAIHRDAATRSPATRLPTASR